MKRRKSREGDERLIHDESANVAERASAIFRLAVDGFTEMEPYLVELLSHKEYLLRAESIKVLLGGWGKERHLDKAIEMLHYDLEYEVRSSTAFSLDGFVVRFEDGQKHKERVLKELIKQLQNDEDQFVQRQCYVSALLIIENKRIGVEVQDNFNREKDVDWNLLKLYV